MSEQTLTFQEVDTEVFMGIYSEFISTDVRPLVVNEQSQKAWEEIDLEKFNMPFDEQEYIKHGCLHPLAGDKKEDGTTDRSNVAWRCSNYLKEAGATRHEISCILSDARFSDGASAKALSNRNGNRNSAYQWAWKYCAPKSESEVSVQSYGAPPEWVTGCESSDSELIQDSDPLALFDQFILSQEEADEMAEPEWLYENLIIRGHMLVLPAPPNAGKTTIMYEIALQLADSNRVFYVHADANSDDVKRMLPKAAEAGLKLLTPDFKTGKSMGHVVALLDRIIMSKERFDNVVFFFDTLKKMTDVINKGQVKKLLGKLRQLSAKGVTIILLAHTNKYRAEDNKLVFEGTGDVRADVDEMIYMYPVQDENTGTLTVTTEIEKSRGKFTPITFTIDGHDRTVELLETVVDTRREAAALARLEKDDPVIFQIDLAIAAGDETQKAIVDSLFTKGDISRKRTRAVLERYTMDMEPGLIEYNMPMRDSQHIYWFKQLGGEHNAFKYVRTDTPDSGYTGPVRTGTPSEELKTGITSLEEKLNNTVN